jgi:exodeoxyribonuclease VII small subunit
MAKSGAKGDTKNGAHVSAAGMKNFEERLERLEELGETIRKPGIPLDDALKSFEEGVRLAKNLEKDLERIENRIEILLNEGDAKPSDEAPELGLFDSEE